MKVMNFPETCKKLVGNKLDYMVFQNLGATKIGETSFWLDGELIHESLIYKDEVIPDDTIIVTALSEKNYFFWVGEASEYRGRLTPEECDEITASLFR
jgi:hypothetical protein